VITLRDRGERLTIGRRGLALRGRHDMTVDGDRKIDKLRNDPLDGMPDQAFMFKPSRSHISNLSHVTKKILHETKSFLDNPRVNAHRPSGPIPFCEASRYPSAP